jgi:hypothetical protein
MFAKRIGMVALVVALAWLTDGVASAADLPRARGADGSRTGQALTVSQLSPETQISVPTSPESNRFKPAVAYNAKHREYLVTWHNTYSTGFREVYGRRFSASGAPQGSPIALSATSGFTDTISRVQPVAAYNAINDEYLAVWMYDISGDGSKYEIWGRIIAWDNSYQKTEFRIFTWANRTFWSPRVAWNSHRNEYFVIWNAIDTTTNLASDVAGVRVSAGGAILPGGPIIITSTNLPTQADMVYTGTLDGYGGYLVVWVRVNAGTGFDIFGGFVRGDGTVVRTDFPVFEGQKDQTVPAVAANQQGSYMVVWQHAYGPGDNDVYGQGLDEELDRLPGGAFPIAAGTANDLWPDVAAKPGTAADFFVVWQQSTATGYAIWGYRLGYPIAKYRFEVTGAAFWEMEVPAVAKGAPEYLIVYEGDSIGDPTIYRHIYGRMWTPEMMFLPGILR